jgi:hypothetical protein
VQLTGEAFDLEELPKLFTAEHQRVVEDEGQYYLEGSDLDVFENAGQVRNVARDILNAVNGAARLVYSNFKPVGLGVVQKIGPDSTTSHQFIETEPVEFRSKVSAVVLSVGSAPVQPPPNPAANWLATARSSEPVRRVLGFLARPKVTWADLYKVIEAVQENGGSHLIGTAVSKADIDRITQTANSRNAIGDDARHGRDSFDAPKKQLLLPEAINVAQTLVRAWIALKT